MGVSFGMKLDCEIPAKTSYQFSYQQKEAFFFYRQSLKFINAPPLLKHGKPLLEPFLKQFTKVSIRC